MRFLRGTFWAHDVVCCILFYICETSFGSDFEPVSGLVFWFRWNVFLGGRWGYFRGFPDHLLNEFFGGFRRLGCQLSTFRTSLFSPSADPFSPRI